MLILTYELVWSIYLVYKLGKKILNEGAFAFITAWT